LGITSGCAVAPLRYCPDASVTRGQMAVFLVRAVDGHDPTTWPSTATFADVPTSHQFFKWVERIYALGITSGCALSPLRYCPNANIPRDQMAVFLTRGFDLPLAP
jgi:hypothetical protein